MVPRVARVKANHPLELDLRGRVATAFEHLNGGLAVLGVEPADHLADRAAGDRRGGEQRRR